MNGKVLTTDEINDIKGVECKMKYVIRAHFFMGIAFFGVFLLSGAYMIFNFPELYGDREEIRMMYRATHIYILMSVLINLMTGSYLLHAEKLDFLKLRKLASLLILLTPMLLFMAFVYEPPEYLIERPISFWAVIFLLVGVMLHVLPNIRWLSKTGR